MDTLPSLALSTTHCSIPLLCLSPPSTSTTTKLYTRWSLSSFQSGLVVSMSLLGALTGSLLALVSGNRIGRRTELMLASLLYGVGATLLGMSPNLGVLLAARVLYGLGIGFAMHAGELRVCVWGGGGVFFGGGMVSWMGGCCVDIGFVMHAGNEVSVECGMKCVLFGPSSC